ncbi:MAG: periplasmic heavy metal sensor [Chrysiogenales bacterium]|nr:MAG: periplasmic heavy metal sensor [Chrysiogenales bacterium]
MLSGGGPDHAGGHDRHGRMGMMHPGGPIFGNPAKMQKELGLTDVQVKEIGDINSEFEKKMLDYREKIAPKRIQLKKLLLEDTVDLVKVRALLQEIGNLRVELHLLRIQHRLEIESKLTAEQKAKVRQHRMHNMKKGKRPPMDCPR